VCISTTTARSSTRRTIVDTFSMGQFYQLWDRQARNMGYTASLTDLPVRMLS